MILNKIKQNLAGFAAVAIAASGFAAATPAVAAGTSVTSGDVSTLYVSRSNNVVVSGNTVTQTATMGADETLQSPYVSIDFADFNNQISLQAGDEFRATVTYTNITDNATSTYTRLNNLNLNAWSGAQNYYGNAYNFNSTSTGTATGTVGFNSPGVATGNYSNFDISVGVNITDTGLGAGDQLQFVYSFKLIRGGVETDLTPLSVQPNGGQNSMSFRKINGVQTHTAASGDYAYSNADFCIYRGENGVTDSSVIEISYSNTGTAGAPNDLSVDGYPFGGGGMTPLTVTTVSTLVKRLTMPASGWSVATVHAYGNSGSLTAGTTYAPVISAVLQGTSTNVLDTCSRSVSGMAAPTVTSGSNSVSVSWTAPAIPGGGTWDNVRIYSCVTSLAGCGNYVAPSPYSASNPSTYSSAQSTGMISNSATSFTVNAQSMMGYGSMQAPPAPWSASTDYKYFVVLRDYDTPYFAVSAVSAAVSGGSVAQVVNNTPQVSAPINSMPTEVPILRPTLGLSQGVRAGGTLVLEAANGATVTEVKVDGQAAALEKVATGVEIVVPTGLTPGAKDLLIKTSTGSTLHVGAIKIADPVLEAQKLAFAKAAASVAFRAPLDLKVSGSAISSKQAAEVRSLVREYRAAKEVVCVAVPATKASTAAARQAAVRACALFKAANRKLKTTVIVEAPSGAAANVVSTELIG